MPKRRQQPDASRRNFLKGAGLVGAAAAVTAPVATNAMPAVPAEKLKAALPGPRQVAAETMPPNSDPVNQSTSGGDFMGRHGELKAPPKSWKDIVAPALLSSPST